MVSIVRAGTPRQCAQVAALVREYACWLRERLDERYLDYWRAHFAAPSFEAELAGLLGACAPPHGRLLLARVDGAPAGCVGLRPLAAGRAELVRLYVRPVHRGLGIGRALVTRLLAEAQAAGYRRVCLFATERQPEARRLYLATGFLEVGGYGALLPLPEHLAQCYEAVLPLAPRPGLHRVA